MGRMEHRCGTRHPVRGTVILRARGVDPVPARIREASISGMFAETAAELFCCNSVIDIETTVPGPAGLRTYRWQAMVIRRTAAGVGLMFDRLRPPAIARLMAIAAMAGIDDVGALAPATATTAQATAGNVVGLRPPVVKSQQL